MHLRATDLQVHPTGLVEPDDPEAKIKLLGEVPLLHRPCRAEVVESPAEVPGC